MAVRPFNFSAGPAAMPAEVLTQAADRASLTWQYFVSGAGAGPVDTMTLTK